MARSMNVGGRQITLADIFKNCEEDGDCRVWKGSVAIGSDRPVWGGTHDDRTGVRRLVAMLTTGKPVPRGLYACVGCDTPRCVAHFSIVNRTGQASIARERGTLGGAKQSVAQAIAKRRDGKLTYEAVARMRERRAEGATLKQIGSEFGVHTSFAHRVVTGKAWAPIGGASVFNLGTAR